MNHKQLVIEAKKWLLNAKCCNPVFCEKGSQGCSEIPDAIGWTTENCIVVECKISKSDFMANCRKDLKLGDKRYFMVPKTLYEEVKEIIPEGYGVITVNETDNGPFTRQERFKDSIKFVSCLESEIRYLRSRILEVQRYGKD